MKTNETSIDPGRFAFPIRFAEELKIKKENLSSNMETKMEQ